MVVGAARMNKIADGLPSKSAKIRALAKAGYKRSEIANFLGCKYQFVRNVLVDDARRTQDKAALLNAGNEPSSSESMKVRMDEGGRIVIPGPVRDTLGLKAGDALIASIEDGELHLLTMRAAAHRAQAIIRRFVPADVSLVDELLEDRRREVENERRDDESHS
jgi:AbrB family looped-hinge helix DNA binding protein